MKLAIKNLQPGMQIKINKKKKNEKNYLVVRAKENDDKGELYLVEAIVINKDDKNFVAKNFNLEWPSKTTKILRTVRYFDYSTIISVSEINEDFLKNAVVYRSAKDNKKWYEANEVKINEQCKKINTKLVNEVNTKEIKTVLPSRKKSLKSEVIVTEQLKQETISTSPKVINKNKDEAKKDLYYQQWKEAIQKAKIPFLKPTTITDKKLITEIQAELQTKFFDLAKTIYIENLPEEFNKELKLEFLNKKSLEKKRNETSEIGGSEQELTFGCTIADKPPFLLTVRASIKVSHEKSIFQLRGWYSNIITSINKFKALIAPVINTFDETENLDFDKDFRKQVGKLKDLYDERMPYLTPAENEDFKAQLENCQVLKDKIDKFIDFINKSDRNTIMVFQTHLEQLGDEAKKYLDNDLPEFVKNNINTIADFDNLVKVISSNHDSLDAKLEHETQKLVNDQKFVNDNYQDINKQWTALTDFYNKSCSKKISFWKKLCFKFKKCFFSKTSKFKVEQAKRRDFSKDFANKGEKWLEKQVKNVQKERIVLPKEYRKLLTVDSFISNKRNSATSFNKNIINKQEINIPSTKLTGNGTISHL